jgi:predicted nucleotidyltransferase
MQINSNQDKIQYKIFGSFCNRFSLLNSSDIDVVLLFDLGDKDTRYKRYKLLTDIN